MDTQAQDTFISEKVQVEVKEGDTVDTAKITHLVTEETDKFVGTINDLKSDISRLESLKKEVTAQLEIQKTFHNDAIKKFDDTIKEKQANIDKYLPEVEAKIRERQP